jgi:hypothetical protein
LNIPEIFQEYQQSTKCYRPRPNAPSQRSCGPAAVLAQSPIAWAIDSVANPHLNNDLGTIIAFPDETFGLNHHHSPYTSPAGPPAGDETPRSARGMGIGILHQPFTMSNYYLPSKTMFMMGHFCMP